MSIYVEHRIDASLEAVWSHTQDPALHERWDLRFTDIDYLPRPDPALPLRFRYATRLGFGISVVGEGETVGQRDLADGSRTSALRFGSDQAHSLIREGRGYWKYVPTPDGVRFITAYDYETRYGWLGRAVDRTVFQPLMGWATAWSFDRLLYVGTWRRIMFPETGRGIPFTIENYAFIDGFGRETVSWVRTFESRRTRRFDAYMIHSGSRGRIVDYLGSHEHLAVDIDLAVDDRGGLRLRSGAQRFYEGHIGFRFPMLFTGVADVHEWYDDAIGRFRIEVDVHNRVWGRLFGYRGSFDVEWVTVGPEGVPDHILPRRQERRE